MSTISITSMIISLAFIAFIFYSVICKIIVYKNWGLRAVLAWIPGISNYELFKYIASTVMTYSYTIVSLVFFVGVTINRSILPSENAIFAFILFILAICSIVLKIILCPILFQAMNIKGFGFAFDYILLEPIFWVLTKHRKYTYDPNRVNHASKGKR